jgi:hypothetical protein
MTKQMTQQEAENIFDSVIGVGFQDDNGFTDLEEARFNYFSKYSDEQLDDIYEMDMQARMVIDRIRKIRAAVWE